jgi:hypothetical protein
MEPIIRKSRTEDGSPTVLSGWVWGLHTRKSQNLHHRESWVDYSDLMDVDPWLSLTDIAEEFVLQ